jgi:hypothetical protein
LPGTAPLAAASICWRSSERFSCGMLEIDQPPQEADHKELADDLEQRCRRLPR